MIINVRALHNGAQAIMLGGTRLVLAYDEQTSDISVIDCARIHVGAVAPAQARMETPKHQGAHSVTA